MSLKKIAYKETSLALDDKGRKTKGTADAANKAMAATATSCAFKGNASDWRRAFLWTLHRFNIGESVRISFSITPQAIRAPELPDGSVA
jgi:hypothetical protein